MEFDGIVLAIALASTFHPRFIQDYFQHFIYLFYLFICKLCDGPEYTKVSLATIVYGIAKVFAKIVVTFVC